MKFTDRTRRILRYRREARSMRKAGWEYVSEGGGKLWELHRGWRIGHRIVAAQVACDGMGIWVQILGENAGNNASSD